MASLRRLYREMIAYFGVDDLEIPLTAVKIFTMGDEIPPVVEENHPTEITLTSCQALRQAALGDAVLLTIDNIGCVAAAITFGLVDAYSSVPLKGPRIYTSIMQSQSTLGESFTPPTPRDFTDGTVYACKSSGKPEFCLFGPDDTGRFKDAATARTAISDMLALQPPTTRGVFFYPPDFQDLPFTPDVVTMSVRPVELTRLIQGYQFNTGKRVTASVGGLRAVNSDLIVRPYLTQEINFTPYCLGARVIAENPPDRMGIGMPFKTFRVLVEGLKDSYGGFPFHLYPGSGAIVRS